MFKLFKKTKSATDNKSLNDGLAKSRQNLVFRIKNLLSGKKIADDLIEELETILLTADVGIKTTDYLIANLLKSIKSKTSNDDLYDLLKQELENLLIDDNELKITDLKPFVILVVGVNGAGKTTTIGKLAKHIQNNNKSVILAAGDTFRAAAIEQLKEWGMRNNIPVISQKTGSDSASVIYDAYQSAKAKNIDVLICDSAGRLHTQSNLMDELKKIKRVLQKAEINAPHETMLVIDGASGQNAVNQAKEFNSAIGLDGIAITKLDGSAKGGIVFSIANEFKLPIRFIGIGEAINDLKVFNKSEFVKALFD